MVSKKEFLLANLKNLNFDDFISPLVSLLTDNIERITFVKDYVGLPNVVVISTKEVVDTISSYEIPYYSSFLVKSKEDQKIKEFYQYDIDDIYTSVNFYLNNSKEKLYVSIVFPECIIDNDDVFKMYYLMEDTNCSVPEAIIAMRKFPEWYDKNSEYPFYLSKQHAMIEEMFSNETNYLVSLKSELYKEMMIAADNNDEKLFNYICEEIKVINNQIEYNRTVR